MGGTRLPAGLALDTTHTGLRLPRTIEKTYKRVPKHAKSKHAHTWACMRELATHVLMRQATPLGDKQP